MKDQIFNQKLDRIQAFSFNREVANVFDDMVGRSIPLYHQVNRLILQLLDSCSPLPHKIYDIGCSTGLNLLSMAQHLRERQQDFQLIGIDYSQEMVDKAREKLNQALPGENRIELICQDIMEHEFQESSCIILNYTLQFLPLSQRPYLLQKIRRALVKGGILILCEKIRYADPFIQDLFTHLYYEFKRDNGYSELEIQQKKAALENVLLPQTPDEHLALLKETQFSKVEVFYKWVNFCGFLAIKEN